MDLRNAVRPARSAVEVIEKDPKQRNKQAGTSSGAASGNGTPPGEVELLTSLRDDLHFKNKLAARSTRLLW